ncbi:hypothetical protein Lser_V15G28767 [Lactuca serriola]
MVSRSYDKVADICDQLMLEPMMIQSSEKVSRGLEPTEANFFSEFGEGSRYKLLEIIRKGSSGIVCSAYDTHVGEKVAIKKINDILEYVSVAASIMREIKLLLLRHPDIVEIKYILLPPSRSEFKDIYVVFEPMGSDLHQSNVFHGDLKPRNILANTDNKLKICDFGLSRAAFNDPPRNCWNGDCERNARSNSRHFCPCRWWWFNCRYCRLCEKSFTRGMNHWCRAS